MAGLRYNDINSWRVVGAVLWWVFVCLLFVLLFGGGGGGIIWVGGEEGGEGCLTSQRHASAS